MFTFEQIKEAHSRVKSGADFPAYIRDIKNLGVTQYTSYVSDGHTEYCGTNGYTFAGPALYASLNISATSNAAQFAADIKAHQQGKTNYPTFCRDCAKSGIEKWTVFLDKMTCTYYDAAGNVILTEQIPQ